MTSPSAADDLQDHIHMLGCQAITEARNLGYGEAKGETDDDDALMAMIDKHEALLVETVLALLDELEKDVIGEDEVFNPNSHYQLAPITVDACNALKAEQRTALVALRAKVGGKDEKA